MVPIEAVLVGDTVPHAYRSFDWFGSPMARIERRGYILSDRLDSSKVPW